MSENLHVTKEICRPFHGGHIHSWFATLRVKAPPSVTVTVFTDNFGNWYEIKVENLGNGERVKWNLSVKLIKMNFDNSVEASIYFKCFPESEFLYYSNLYFFTAVGQVAYFTKTIGSKQAKTFDFKLYFTILSKPLSVLTCLVGQKELGKKAIAGLHFKADDQPVDVTLKCGERQWPCHKTLLAGLSPMFKAMFGNNGFRESKCKEFEIKGFDPDTVNEMVHYLYNAKFQNENLNWEEMLVVSDFYDIPTIRGVSIEMLKHQLNFDNAIDTLLLGQILSCEVLKTAVLRFITVNNNLKSVKKSLAWKELRLTNFEMFQELLSCLPTRKRKYKYGEEDDLEEKKTWKIRSDDDSRDEDSMNKN